MKKKKKKKELCKGCVFVLSRYDWLQEFHPTTQNDSQRGSFLIAGPQHKTENREQPYCSSFYLEENYTMSPQSMQSSLGAPVRNYFYLTNQQQ